MNERETEIKLKLQKAEATMDEVDFLLQNKFYNTAINRLYYSCFYVPTALLLAKGFNTKTHKGVSVFLSKEFLQKGLIDQKHVSLFTKLMNERLESDYGDY